MPLNIEPLCDAIGAEVKGIDLSRPVPPDAAAELLDAWHRHILLLLRDQSLDDAAVKRSAAWLGETGPITMPTTRRGDSDTSVQLVSNIRYDAGRAIGALGDGEMWFHHDNSFMPSPDKATYLYAVELPNSGGHTLFGNTYLSYEALPDGLRRAITGRRVLQVYDYTIREKPSAADLERVPHCWQPAVVRHPATGRCALYVDRLMSVAIEGMPEDESAALLNELFPYVERADYEHVWRLGDYVIWDNRCSVHARTDFPADQRRLLKRGKVAGEALIAAVAA